MIELHIEDYCHSCPDFEADVSKNAFRNLEGDKVINITVYCEHQHRCRAIKRYLEKQEDKKENQDNGLDN